VIHKIDRFARDAEVVLRRSRTSIGTR
jgi:hypothetical protein